jgi:3-oxoacyl-[acyl-carrier protein] reductase
MRAVVTGARRGIGAAIAERLAADGYEIIGLDVNDGDGVLRCDIADETAVEALAAELGAVDVLVNNAAVRRFAPLEELTAADFEWVVDVNLNGAFFCMKAFGRRMLDTGRGAILNVASGAAMNPNVGGGAYACSKAGLVALTKQAALEWGPRGIRVNAIAPGYVATEGASTATGAPRYDDPDVDRRLSEVVPLRRLGLKSDIAEAVAFLVSEKAAYVTGQVLIVDGGMSSAMSTMIPRLLAT